MCAGHAASGSVAARAQAHSTHTRDQVHGGAVLVGSNFVPSHFLWCAFAVPPAEASTRGAWRWTRGVYINATAVRCEVPQGFIGDFQVAHLGT